MPLRAQFEAILLDGNDFHSPIDQHIINTQPGSALPHIRAVRVHCGRQTRVCLTLWNTRDLLKTRLQVTSVFMAVRPYPHAFKRQASTPAQRLEPAVGIEQGHNQCSATLGDLYDD